MAMLFSQTFNQTLWCVPDDLLEEEKTAVGESWSAAVGIIMDDEVDAVGPEGVEDGPDLGLVLESLLGHLLSGVGVNGLPGEAVDAEAHGEDLAHRRGRLGVHRAPALEPFLERLLHRRRRRRHAAQAAVHHVGRHVLERDEEPEHVPVARQRAQRPQRRQWRRRRHQIGVRTGDRDTRPCLLIPFRASVYYEGSERDERERREGLRS